MTQTGSPMTIAYLAARYSRLDELNGYKRDLEALGVMVPARWLLGEHRIIDGLSGPQNAEFAADDYADLSNAKVFIAFTEPPGSGAARGGRHVEAGIALERFRQGRDPDYLFLVGPRENVFYYLPEWTAFDTWESCLQRVGDMEEATKAPRPLRRWDPFRLPGEAP